MKNSLKTSSGKKRDSKSPSLRELWQALADPTRLRLVALIRTEELSVAELQEILHVGQSRISMHLGILRSCGLAEVRREGKFSYYRLATLDSREARALLEAGLSTLTELSESSQDLDALRLAVQKRREIAQQYFNQIAGRMGKAHCPGRGWTAVGPLLAQLVPSCVIADLGAGEGWLSQLLAQHAEQVIAVDSSAKMVEFGRAEAKKKKLSNLDYRLGDLSDPPIKAGTIDIVILSQALHHVPNPAQAVKAAVGLLRPGGRLIVLDLNAHQFDRARVLFGDYWLGFSETELRQWMREAGLTDLRFQLLPPEEGEPVKLSPCLAFGRKRG